MCWYNSGAWPSLPLKQEQTVTMGALFSFRVEVEREHEGAVLTPAAVPVGETGLFKMGAKKRSFSQW